MLTIVQARCFSLFGHVAYETDANEELNSFPLGELEETTGTPSYYMDEDYPAGPEIQQPFSQNEAIDVAQNHPLWRLMSTFGATHCHSVACEKR